MAQTKGGSPTWRFSPLMIGAIVVALLFTGIGMAALNERSYRIKETEEAGVQAAILAATVTAALAFEDRPAAQEYVNALKVNPDVLGVAVYDADGALFVSFTRPGQRPFPDPAANPATERSASVVDGVLRVSSPVAQNGAALGSIRLRTVVEPFLSRLERYVGIGLLVTMACLVVIVLGSAHAAMARINAELRQQAAALSEAYAKLKAETAEREKAEEALRQSQKMEAVGQLTGGVAHDFNNLLQAVTGSLDIIDRRLQAGRAGEIGRYVRTARTSVDRAAALTQRLLAFSRRQPLNPRGVDVNALVGGMYDLIRRSMGEAIAVEVRLADGLWTTWADANQLENGLLNLAINARDAMPRGGRLTIATGNATLGEADLVRMPGMAPGDYVRLSVADTGTGMSPEVMARVFEPFFTTKPIGQGTGLGLSQLYGFARQSGGHVDIASEPEEGTVVTLYLPRHHGAADAAGDAAAEAPPLAAGHGRILVVEDEALVRMLLVATLEEQDYTVVEADCAETALRILESELAIDLLATDVGLPGLNGRQLSERARSLRPGLKVLFLTGYAHNAGLGDVTLDETTQLLSKPVAMATFLAKVQTMLGMVAEPQSAGTGEGSPATGAVVPPPAV